MKVGVISDIHADLESLEAVIRRLERAEVDTIVCGGDLVERGCDGNAVAQLLRTNSIPCVKGNHDENAIRHAKLSKEPEYAHRLSNETLAFLDELPSTRELSIEGVELMLTHAIPSDNGGAAFQDETLKKLSKRFKKDLARVEADVVIVGHTHFPFDVKYRDKWIVNPGCVCNLQSRDSHTYGILDLTELTFAIFKVSSGEPTDLFTATFD